MTTTRVELTDALIRDALRDLASGPDAGALTADVLRQVGRIEQGRGVPWPIFERHPRAALVGFVALFVLGLIGAVVGAGMLPSTNLITGGLPAIVVQQSNDLRDPDFRVAQTRFSPGGTVGTLLSGFPPNAVGLRWSPDGTRLAYFEESAPADLKSLPLTALVLANRDGSNPVRVATPRSLDQYVSNGFWAGVQWAPAGRRFLLAWTTGFCPGTSADCIPPAGIDVFDAAGNVISMIDTPNNVGIDAFWSADGLGVAWTSGECVNNACTATAYHWRRFGGDAAVTTIQTGRVGQVVWGQDGLLHVVRIDDTGLAGVATMAIDGSNLRDVPWVSRTTESGPTWSPDGRFLAAVDFTNGTLRVRDVQAGTEIVVPSVPGFQVASWALDSSRLALVGDTSSSKIPGYGFWVINADGTGLASLGDGEDFSWLPEPGVSQ